jgi:hypothetical protein
MSVVHKSVEDAIGEALTRGITEGLLRVLSMDTRFRGHRGLLSRSPYPWFVSSIATPLSTLDSCRRRSPFLHNRSPIGFSRSPHEEGKSACRNSQPLLFETSPSVQRMRPRIIRARGTRDEHYAARCRARREGHIVLAAHLKRSSSGLGSDFCRKRARRGSCFKRSMASMASKIVRRRHSAL